MKGIAVAVCLMLCFVSLASASPDGARVEGDLRIGGVGSGAEGQVLGN